MQTVQQFNISLGYKRNHYFSFAGRLKWRPDFRACDSRLMMIWSWIVMTLRRRRGWPPVGVLVVWRRRSRRELRATAQSGET